MEFPCPILVIGGEEDYVKNTLYDAHRSVIVSDLVLFPLSCMKRLHITRPMKHDKIAALPVLTHSPYISVGN